MDFTAIDFETANELRTSPCSVGLAVVRGGEITLAREWLIQPASFRFEPFNVGIHGIRPEMVEDAPTLDALWPTLWGHMEGYPVTAHNASFDMSVLRSTLAHYGIAMPKMDVVCTVKLSRRSFPDLPNHRLSTVAGHLGVKFAHHNAREDAVACARVALAACEVAGEKSLLDAARFFDVLRAKRPQLIPDVPIISDAFAGQQFVFMGALETMSLAQAKICVRERSGYVTRSAGRKTSYVVVGAEVSQALREGSRSRRIKRLDALLQGDTGLKLLHEWDFLTLLGPRAG